ncbi:MAG: glutaredoxin 3 [Pseudomonadota bacterium]|nr:glutaredoxin 3 [Pseudomonadota bacterium]
MTRAAATVYVTSWCPYCQRARALLSAKNLVLDVIDVDDDPKFREEMAARSGRRTVPQIFIGQKHVGGCDDLFELEGSGELDRLISINSGQGD